MRWGDSIWMNPKGQASGPQQRKGNSSNFSFSVHLWKNAINAKRDSVSLFQCPPRFYLGHQEAHTLVQPTDCCDGKMSMAEDFIRKEVMEWALQSDEGHDVDSCWTLARAPFACVHCIWWYQSRESCGIERKHVARQETRECVIGA